MIKLTDKYSLEADRYNYALVETKTNRNGEPITATLGYFTTAAGAVNWIFRIETRRYIHENNATLTEALEAFKAIQNEVNEWGKETIKKLESEKVG